MSLGLNPVHPLPDPESKDYIVVNTMESEAPENFNNEVRSTRTISISGKTIVFHDGHPNGLYAFNDNEDIKKMSVYAETLIIRSPLMLPQTDLAIYPRELRFENSAYINTAPRSLTNRPAQFQDGIHGIKAGDVTLHIEAFHSDSGQNLQFILRGGNGQPAGLGQDGAAGLDMEVFSNSLIQDPFHATCPWPDNTTYISCRFLLITLIVGREWGDPDSWPGDGENAVAGGKPGNGGDGGNIRCNLTTPAPYTDFSGGRAGDLAEIAIGGRAGNPTPAYRTRFDLSAWSITEQHTSNSGYNANPPSADVQSGQEGAFSQLGHYLSWLSPYALRSVLAHAKDAYLHGHIDYVKGILEDYLELLDNYSGLDSWNDLSDEWRIEFGQMRSEIQALLHLIGYNLDFFGNPAGWVPMLSFEVTLAAFENEIDHAIRTLYLAYWVENAASDLQGKVNALKTAREQLKDEIEEFKLQYNTARDLIPVLKSESIYVANQGQYLQGRLQDLEKELLRQAEYNVSKRHEVPSLKKGLRVLGTILKVIPAGQPIFGSIGTGLDLITQFDSYTPWERIDKVIDVASEFNDPNIFEKSVEDWKTEMDKINLKTIEYGDIIASVKNLKDFAKPIVQELTDVQNIMRQTQVPRSEVEAEFQRLKASHPEFNELAVEINELMVRKEAFARQLASTMQKIETLSDGITLDLLAIDGLNRDIFQGNAIIDHRATMYLHEMKRRAKERLLKYHYYMAKAYEYRMLSPYTGELNLNRLFDKFRNIVEAGSDQNLSSVDFDALMAIYEEQLSTIVANTFDTLASNPPELSAPVEFNLSQEEIDKLNNGESVTINLVERGLFLASEENIRIVDLNVDELDAHLEGGDIGLFAYLNLYMEHSGQSKLSKDGEKYLFNHYNDNTDNPLIWGARYELCFIRIISY